MDLTTLIWKQKNHTPSITGTLNHKDYSIIMSSDWNRCAERWQLWNFYFWRLLVDSKVRLLSTEKERFKLWSSNHSKSPNENDFIGHPGVRSSWNPDRYGLSGPKIRTRTGPMKSGPKYPDHGPAVRATMPSTIDFESIQKFIFRVVLCQIRLFPTLISKIEWLWSGVQTLDYP